jgi:hypothetical protein
LTGGLLSAAVLVGLNVLVAFITARSSRAQTLVEGRDVLVGRNLDLFKETKCACAWSKGLNHHRIEAGETMPTELTPDHGSVNAKPPQSSTQKASHTYAGS